MWGLIGSVYGWGGWLWLVWGRRGKAQVRELGRGQGNFKLAANFGYNSRGSADPRESLRKRQITDTRLRTLVYRIFRYIQIIQEVPIIERMDCKVIDLKKCEQAFQKWGKQTPTLEEIRSELF